MPNPVPNSMFIEPIIPSTAVETTRRLKNKSISGHDEILTKLLTRFHKLCCCANHTHYKSISRH